MFSIDVWLLVLVVVHFVRKMLSANGTILKGYNFVCVQRDLLEMVYHRVNQLHRHRVTYETIAVEMLFAHQIICRCLENKR